MKNNDNQNNTQWQNGVTSTFRKIARFPIIPVIILAIFLFIGIFGGLLMPHSPYEGNLADRLLPPSWMAEGSSQYLLGTDALGQDILSRLILGTRITLIVSSGAVIVAGIIGSLLGMVAAYGGGIFDAIAMRMCDIMYSFPIILIALLFAIIFGPSMLNLVVILVVATWAIYARVVRGDALTWKYRDFVTYARLAGTSPIMILIRHLLPNVASTIIVLSTFNTANVIILEASLSFLGAGVPPPTPSFGSMAAAGRDYISTAWWVSVIPGSVIVLVVLSLNLFGDWLRDYLDPKLRQI